MEAETGESHSMAVTDLVIRAKASEQFAPADIQALLAFISAPKPGDLTDGEWEERVNGILNLLRRQTEDVETEDRRQENASRQTQDFKTQDAREEGASSLASSGPANQGAAGPPRPTGSAVPGLTEYLLETAERNPSKVLRLYAMQHLSLWFEKETDPVKRRAMVGLLEKLATTPGGDTAGCAVLMLADMHRKETEDFETEDRRQEVSSGRFQVSRGEDGAGGAPQGQIQNPSANPSATSASPRFVSADDGIDWGRVDETLEGASRRLVGEAGTGADVRISAIHACVDRKDAGALPDLRRIAADTSLVSTLRKAAIHALGQLGTSEDVALLDSLPGDDSNLGQAIHPARRSLAARLPTPNRAAK
jgi:hypothetical protein